MMRNRLTQFFLVVLAAVLVASSPALASHPFDEQAWSPDEVKILRGLRLKALPPLPPDPSNRYTEDPRAVALGKKLFADARFSGNLEVSCATCHRPDYEFTDSLPLAHGMGFTRRRSMPLAGMAYSPWLFWDGRKDSLWSQALGPVESPVEHGISRTLAARLLYEHYRAEYEDLFGPLPVFLVEEPSAIARPATDNPLAQAAWEALTAEQQQAINRAYANFGKSIGAFVRRILPGESRFDRYVEAVLTGDLQARAAILSTDEALGLRLFIGRAKCINCHNGPLFTNFDFHNVGVPVPVKSAPDNGRAEGIDLVRSDEFNCLGQYSDAGPRDCAELRFMEIDTEKYKETFKTPSLRNVARRPPFMHAGQFTNLAQILNHYSTVRPNGPISPELAHQNLSRDELLQLEAFLHTLTGTTTSP